MNDRKGFRESVARTGSRTWKVMPSARVGFRTMNSGGSETLEKVSGNKGWKTLRGITQRVVLCHQSAHYIHLGLSIEL